MHIFFHRDASCPQNLHRLPEETHIKRLSGLGHEGTAFQRYCFCQRYKQRGLEGQATEGKATIFFHPHKPAVFLKEMDICLEILHGFYSFFDMKKFEASCNTRQREREEKLKGCKKDIKKKKYIYCYVKVWGKV